MAERWRVGGKLKRTLYRDEQLVGLVDTPELAAEIVETMNRVGRLLDEVRGQVEREHREAAEIRERSQTEIGRQVCGACLNTVAVLGTRRLAYHLENGGLLCDGSDRVAERPIQAPPGDAQRRSEATPQKDLPGFHHLGDIPPPVATAEELDGATVIPVPPEQADKIREAFGWSRVDPYDTTKGGIA